MYFYGHLDPTKKNHHDRNYPSIALFQNVEVYTVCPFKSQFKESLIRHCSKQRPCYESQTLVIIMFSSP